MSEPLPNGRVNIITEAYGPSICMLMSSMCPTDMEDAHAAILDLDQTSDESTNAFFAVYDGHGGM